MSTEPGKISSTRLHTGHIIKLDADVVRFPDGTTGHLDIIRHPGASAVVPLLNEDGSSSPASDPMILMIRQYRYATNGYLYEVPAGRLDAGEDPATCAKRELKEETGYDAEHVELLLTMFTTPGFTDEKIHLFYATGCVAGESHREADEFLELHPVRLSKAIGMIESAEIQDAKTALALYLTARRLKVL